ncbi:MAG TPA: hypothetical protein VFH58_14145 [Acidimicrobiales bacterium]|nr:hypothetical protein [Acidimicrobiales bacterium]
MGPNRGRGPTNQHDRNGLLLNRPAQQDVEDKYAAITELQRTAGNAAVTQLVTVQRHSVPSIDDDTEPSAPEPQTLSEESATAGEEHTEAPAEAPLLEPGGLLGSAGAGPGHGTAGAGGSLDGLDLGMLGSIRTPARLESATAGRRFAQEMVGEEHQWATQTGPDARASALTDMIGRSLSDAGVSPVPGYTLRSDLSPNTLGNFGFANWKININQRLVSRPNLTTEQANEIANTFYHEGRHCDQWFRMARLRAGQGQSAADIAHAMGIPNNVAASATASPLQAGSAEATEAQGWWDSVYGAHRTDRNQTLGELAASDTANAAAAQAYAADSTPANLAAWQAATARRQRAFTAYQALPEEVSARAAASTMQAALVEARRLNGKPADDPLLRAPRRRLEGSGDFPVPATTGQGAA